MRVAATLSFVAVLGSLVLATPAVAKRPPPPPASSGPGHDFIAEIDELRAIALCDRKEPWTKAAKVQARHCKRIAGIQQGYRDRWLNGAPAFFKTVVPADVPKTVVYPFAGGDLSTALAVYPDATEITTLSLEPAGDPRTLAALKDGEVVAALDTIAYELDFLYRINFSNTKNMIGAMRGGRLPTQLTFSLSAMDLHGYQITHAYFFQLREDGSLDYVDDADLAAMPPVDKKGAGDRNKAFGNVELRFRKPGETTERVYRHIQWNLDDEHLKADGRVLKHLEAKGKIAAMTKAASYLLHWDSFSLIRTYLLASMTFMVSDATGPKLKHAQAAGFTQEVWGSFAGAHMTAGKGSNPELFKLFKSQPARKMPVRFGYPDRTGKPHLIVTRRP